MYQTLVQMLDPFLVMGLLLLLVATRSYFKEGRRLIPAITVLTMLTATPAIAHLAMGSLEWWYRPQQERPDSAAAIVVLSGSLRPLDDAWTQVELGPDTLYRCLAAIRLYHAGQPCPVIVSGGKVDPQRPGPSLAAAMREYLVRNGIPEQQIIVEESSTNTFENAVATAQLLTEQNLQPVVLVTDAMHLLRAELCFRAQGIEVVPCGCYHRATRFEWSLLSVVPRGVAADNLRRAVHEWLGIVWYRLRGRI